MHFRCPNCQQQIRVDNAAPVANDPTLSAVECPSCHSRFNLEFDAEATVPNAVGTRIGHFDIVELLGEGSFGSVYKALDTELQRFIAIKVPRHGRLSGDLAKLFLREARAAAEVTHPNVVSVYEVGQYQSSYYIACQYIDGVSLSELLKIRKFSPTDSARLLIQILRAMQAFHSKGIIHRDIKPGNILMDQQLVPYIADFGLARHESPNELTVTQDGRIVGTLAYMPPEQARGDSKEVSHRSDVYAVGVILYEMLAGTKPFQATSSRALVQCILSQDPEAPRSRHPAIARDLETICLKAIEKDPKKRYESADAMADDLQRFLDGRPIVARPVSIVERCWRWIRRNPALTTTISLAVTLLVAAVVVFYRSLPFTHHVEVTYRLSGTSIPAESTADWAVVPLQSKSREPDLSRIQKFEDRKSLSLNLLPGEYLVVVQVAGFGFHEVYRTVPEKDVTAPTLTLPQSFWTITESGQLKWPDVTIIEEGIVTNTMSQVPGGVFVMGDSATDRPAHSRTVDAFYVDPTEVTVRQYKEFSELPSDYPEPLSSEDLPIVYVTWNTATAFAEATGRRLLTEAEFEYLATDLGRVDSGNSAPPADGPKRSYGVAGMPADDRLRDLDVTGINSNVAEWTESVMNPYPGQKPFSDQVDRYTHRLDGRVVRGGPVSAGRNDRLQNPAATNVRARTFWFSETRDDELGFRCARSQKPRFIE